MPKHEIFLNSLSIIEERLNHIKNLSSIEPCFKFFLNSAETALIEVSLIKSRLDENCTEIMDLQKCPFCGEESGIFESSKFNLISVRCENCGSSTSTYRNIEEAAAAWSKRA